MKNQLESKKPNSKPELYTVLPNVKKGVREERGQIYKNRNLQDLPNEEWVDVYGYDGMYEVSNLGRVKSLERYVDNGRGGEMYVKPIILAQSFAGKKKRRLNVGFSLNGICRKFEVNTVVYYSFYPEKLSENNGMEVCHLNKNALDNRLVNLKLMTHSESSKIGVLFGVSQAMIESNKLRSVEYDKIKNKVCSVCNNKKDIKEFERGRRKCNKCKNLESYNKRLKKKGKERVNDKKVYITDTVTKKVFIHTNKTKCVISSQIIDKYANTKKLVIPYNNSKHINPLLVEIK